jgi:hypothetical protein
MVSDDTSRSIKAYGNPIATIAHHIQLEDGCCNRATSMVLRAVWHRHSQTMFASIKDPWARSPTVAPESFEHVRRPRPPTSRVPHHLGTVTPLGEFGRQVGNEEDVRDWSSSHSIRRPLSRFPSPLRQCELPRTPDLATTILPSRSAAMNLTNVGLARRRIARTSEFGLTKENVCCNP